MTEQKTLWAPLEWSFKEVADDIVEFWVDGIETGPGTLLGRFIFEPEWGPEARAVNSQAIVQSVNGHAALVQTVLLVAKGIRNKNIKDQSILDFAAAAGKASVEPEALSEILRRALDKAGYRLEFK